MRLRTATAGLASLALAAGLIWSAQAPSLDFVHITDTHVRSLEGVHPGIRAALAARTKANGNLTAALQAISEGPRPAFVLATGDLVEGYQFEGESGRTVRGQVEFFAELVKRIPAPLFPVLGNHDLTGYKPGEKKMAADQSVAGDARRAWSSVVEGFKGGTYYSFPRNVGKTPYLFVALDNGEAAGRDPDFAAAQVKWLKETLESHQSGPVVVAMHIPLPQPPNRPLITAAIQDALATSPRVSLIIAGHRHSDGVETVETGERKVTQVRTAAIFLSEKNWRRLRLLEDRIEVYATGKPEERVATVALKGMAAAAGK